MCKRLTYSYSCGHEEQAFLRCTLYLAQKRQQTDKMEAMFSAALPVWDEITNPRGPAYWYMLSEPRIVCEDTSDESLADAPDSIFMDWECDECMEREAAERRLKAFVNISVLSDLHILGRILPSAQDLEDIFQIVKRGHSRSVAPYVNLTGFYDEDLPHDSNLPNHTLHYYNMAVSQVQAILQGFPELIPLRDIIFDTTVDVTWSSQPRRKPLATMTESQLNIQQPAARRGPRSYGAQNRENIPPPVEAETPPRDQENLF